MSLPPLNYLLPRNEAESHAVIEHGVAPAGKHDAAPVDAGHALPIGHRAMLQAGFGRNLPRSLRQLAPAQRRQQVACEDDALSAPLSQSLFGQETGALV